MSGKYCKNCKWLDKSQIVHWSGMFNDFYACKKKKLEQQAHKNMGYPTTMFYPSYLDVDGFQHGLAYCLDDISETEKKYLDYLDFGESENE